MNPPPENQFGVFQSPYEPSVELRDLGKNGLDEVTVSQVVQPKAVPADELK